MVRPQPYNLPAGVYGFIFDLKTQYCRSHVGERLLEYTDR